MNTQNFHLTQDGQIFDGNVCIGYVEGDQIWLYVNDEAIKIGTFEHRREVFSIVQDWRERK